MKNALTTLLLLTAFSTASAESHPGATTPVPVVEAVIPQAADWAEVDVVGYPDFRCSLYSSSDLQEWRLVASGNLGETGAATFVDRQVSPNTTILSLLL